MNGALNLYDVNDGTTGTLAHLHALNSIPFKAKAETTPVGTFAIHRRKLVYYIMTNEKI